MPSLITGELERYDAEQYDLNTLLVYFFNTAHLIANNLLTAYIDISNK